MSPAEAVEQVAACLEADRFTIREHVYRRLEERHLMLPDLLSLLSEPDDAHSDGLDQHGRERWFLNGRLHDGTVAETLVLLDCRPHATVFTIYWMD